MNWKTDKDLVYYVLSSCGLPDRTIKFHIEKTYDPPRQLYNTVSSDVYCLQDNEIFFDINTGDETLYPNDIEYIKDLRFEYDLKDEIVYIYYKTNLDSTERLLYALSKKFIENHFEPREPHLKIDIDLTLPGQEKLQSLNGLTRLKTYIKNTELRSIELKNNIFQQGYRFNGGDHVSGGVNLREWNMQAYLRLDTMCYDASKEFNECFIKFKYFFIRHCSWF